MRRYRAMIYEREPIKLGCGREDDSDRTGQDRIGQYSAVQYSTVQDRTGQDRTGQDRTGQDRTELKAPARAYNFKMEFK